MIMQPHSEKHVLCVWDAICEKLTITVKAGIQTTGSLIVIVSDKREEKNP